MAESGTSSQENLLAWQGLAIPIQEEWRPLKIEGDHQKGAITVGSMDGPVFQLRWLRPPKSYDAAEWIKKRCRAVAGGQTSDDPPRPDGFAMASWVRSLAIRQESEKTVWWGYAEPAHLLVEILLTNLCDDKTNAWFIRHALPKLTVAAATEDCPWSIYSSRCVIPPGYILRRQRLAAGDIALEFTADKGRRLLVRQVFPALLALQRRPYAGWLRDRVFKERRRFRKDCETTREDGLRMTWTGWKRIPFPLGFLLPRRWETVVAHDEYLDRLLIVESEWRDGATVKSAEDILKTMRRAS